MLRIELKGTDRRRAESLVAELAGRYSSTEEPEFVRAAGVYAASLPDSLQSALSDFRLSETEAACLITGFGVDESSLPPTPEQFGGQVSSEGTLRPDIFFFLCGSLLGDAIGWETQQAGRLMHDSIAVRGAPKIQVPASRIARAWHTEDAAHPCRADYVGFMCLRDETRTATTYASIGDVEIDDDALDLLMSDRFLIRTGDPHLAVDGQHTSECAKIAILFGNPEWPYLRLDPYFMLETPEDAKAAAVLLRLVKTIDEALIPVSLAPGDVIFIDNYLAVHGRQGFRPRFDGTDRWLKGLNIVRDLRKSAVLRHGPQGRVIFGLPWPQLTGAAGILPSMRQQAGRGDVDLAEVPVV